MSPQLISSTDRSSRAPAPGLTALGCLAVVLAASSIATQSPFIPGQRSTNSNSDTKRQRIATLRAQESSEGSRATLSADQSLSNYEAYRRGDRFYVKIPPSDVPNPEAVHGRAFGDVKVQQATDGTLVSFHLQPGTTAHVEQRGNKLDVIFTMPGARTAAKSAGRAVTRKDAGPGSSIPDSKRRNSSNSNTSPANRSSGRDRNMADHDAAARLMPVPKPQPSSESLPSPSPSPSPNGTASPASSVVAQQKNSPSPLTATNQQAQGNTWANLKQRIRYWILLAQLNPIPVAIGAIVLLFLIGLLIFQRRRAKATELVLYPRTVTGVERTVKTSTRVSVPESIKPAEASPVPATGIAAARGAATAVVAGATVSGPSRQRETPALSARQERIAHISDEVKKLMAGGEYDESIVASDDRETRKFVGAELLSALVGRNLQRRERARAAFMKHGYFDDATRDLRVAESANERAAAARRLSFAHDREATPHLVAALEDPAPDVRRAVVEALMDLRDPAAIAPLNSLMQTESDRKVPRTLLKQAVEACATGHADESITMPAPSSLSPEAAASVPPQPEIEREVIEI